MIDAVHVALWRLYSFSTVKNSYSLPFGWPQPKFWLGQSVLWLDDPRNHGVIIGLEFMSQELADCYETDSGWWYSVCLSLDSPRQPLEPQMMLQEFRLALPPDRAGGVLAVDLRSSVA